MSTYIVRSGPGLQTETHYKYGPPANAEYDRAAAAGPAKLLRLDAAGGVPKLIRSSDESNAPALTPIVGLSGTDVQPPAPGTRRQLRSDDGSKLDAEFSVETVDGELSVYLFSAGGTGRDGNARNPDYRNALVCILARVFASECEIGRIELQTRRTVALPAADRVVNIPSTTYPLRPGRTHAAVVELGKVIQSCQTKMARAPGASGSGNSTKALRMYVSPPAGVGESRLTQLIMLGSDAHTQYLEDGEAASDPTDDLSSAAQEPFAPSDKDRRGTAMRFIKERRGQQAFRASLMDRFDGRCVASGCAVRAVLEAAHIMPYRGIGDNHVDNGLLLRADLHTLFDLDLLGIEPVSLRVHLNPLALGTYAELHEKILRIGDRLPSREALERRWLDFKARLEEVDA